MNRLARWLLVLALSSSSLAPAAPAGGDTSKKSASKTTPAAKPKPKPKATSAASDEAEAETEDRPESGKKKALPKVEAASRRPPSTAEGANPQTAAKTPAKGSSKVTPKANTDAPSAPKSKSERASKTDSGGLRPSTETSKAKEKADAEPDAPAKAKTKGQGTASKADDTSPPSSKPKGKTSSKNSPTKPATSKKRPASNEDTEPSDATPPVKKSTSAKAKPGTKSVEKRRPDSSEKSAKKPAAEPIDNAGDPAAERSRVTGANATIAPTEIENFSANPARVQTLLRLGLGLTERDLTYRYGSADPDTGGMDCSGTVYYLLRAAGVKDVPRDSSSLYLWAQKAGTLRTVQAASLDDAQFADLRPGDLLFWEGTYDVQRVPPISHTMIYLGREVTTGARVMVGASDGRSYRGVRRNGVSVFDFKLPKPDSAARFVAYARVPGLE